MAESILSSAMDSITSSNSRSIRCVISSIDSSAAVSVGVFAVAAAVAAATFVFVFTVAVAAAIVASHLLLLSSAVTVAAATLAFNGATAASHLFSPLNSISGISFSSCSSRVSLVRFV